jgi:hypothetical protein
VLVLTPSRLVRDQIAIGFEHLMLLKSLGILPQDLTCPAVRKVSSQLKSCEAWDELRKFDVVVATPQSVSPAIVGIATPPADLFSVIMVDEAHHTPAVSYTGVLDSFPNAKKAFFTATPFRRDKKAIPGKLVYSYPLKSAIEDGTYGKIVYVPCIPAVGDNHDAAIARLAEAIFKTDAKSNLDHRLMVRTDSVSRAKELEAIYEYETELKLKLVHGGHSINHVNSVMAKLSSGELDGIICVDMFAEGVDFPRLKLAALHAPHKSLAVTLQFIGRFARTNSADLGTARFIAVPQEIDAEVRELFRNGANWQDLVTNLADARVEEEAFVREGLASFETGHSVETESIDLTIDCLTPYFHAKVYRTSEQPELSSTPFVPQGCELTFHAVSDDLSAAVIVCQRKTKPKWLNSPSIVDTKHLLIVVHYDRFNQLLFINSVEHGEDLYERIVESLYGEDSHAVCMPLPHNIISRALRILEKPSFYNIGMRNRELGGQDESYRILTGPKADRRVSRTDANTRSRGHVFGGSSGSAESITLGVSTLSKLWSNKYGLIPRFVEWCHGLAEEICRPAAVSTGSNIDLLDTGIPIKTIPSPPIGIVWHEHVYRHPQLLSIDGGPERDLTGMELTVDTSTYTKTSVEVCLIVDECCVARFTYCPSASEIITEIEKMSLLEMRNPLGNGTLTQFLNLRPPTLYLSDFSTLIGNHWYRRTSFSPFDPATIRTFDQFGSTVDIEQECAGARTGMQTIHEFTELQFLSESADVVIYDHRTGEVADFVSLSDLEDVVICQLGHCKGASGKKVKTKCKSAGSRVDDAYEVAGQVVKCLPFRRPEELKDKLLHRLAGGSILKRGTMEQMERILDNATKKRFEFRICLIQPGLSAAKLTEPVKNVLAAASEYVMGNSGILPSIWVSP